MKQHLHTAAERTISSIAAPCPEGVLRPDVSTRAARTAHPIENASTICAKRRHAHGTDGIWPNTPVALATAVFAPYHQRPKDAVA